MKRVRIGNGCGFWGDNLDAPIQLAERGRLDYLTLEYLAELTMSILALLKQRDANAGFAHDFLDVLKRLGPSLRSQPGLKVVTNAGGMNPRALALQAKEILAVEGLSARTVGIVDGDDLLPRLDAILEAGHPLTNLDTGEPLSMIRDRIVSANAYLGSAGIAAALAQGASIVVTGRVADASLTVGPAMHEFGKPYDDWHFLSAATVAGHLIECGAQATGGLWCNYPEAPDLADVGYPIAELCDDGSMTIMKPPSTGGRINVETIAEQLLYEVGDPAAYLTPDVVSDFTSVRLTETGPDEVTVEQSRGFPATDSYKVSIAYRNGYTASGTLVLSGPDAANKARFAGQMLLDRLKRIGLSFAESYVEVLGAGDVVPGVIRPISPPVEVVLRVAVRDANRKAVERFTKEFAPLVTSGPPGVTGYTTGRPSLREVFAYWPALLKKSAIEPYRLEVV
jgi:Acyclic terpene utilisation family protein AtuA